MPDGRTITYEIDALQRRIGKRVNGVRQYGLLYQSQLAPIAQLDANNAVVATFVYGARPNVPDYMTSGGQRYRFVTDHLGSVRMVVRTTDGAVVQRLDYDEFGNVLADTNPGVQPFGFAGGLYDADTGLVRFGARDYDAVAGRWTAKDPSLFRGGLNLYSYANNDPFNFIDVTGYGPTRAEVQRAYRDAYNQWWNTRPNKFRQWGPFSNWAANFDSSRPVCEDYSKAAAGWMNDTVRIPGTGAFPVWDFEKPTDKFGEFESSGDVGWHPHNTVRVYMTGADGKPELVDQYDPWWQW